jgi:hypothetical protein
MSSKPLALDLSKLSINLFASRPAAVDPSAMIVKITDHRFGGIKRVLTADQTGLAEGGRFRLVSMTIPFCRAHLHERDGVSHVTGYSEDGRRTITARLADVIALPQFDSSLQSEQAAERFSGAGFSRPRRSSYP